MNAGIVKTMKCPKCLDVDLVYTGWSADGKEAPIKCNYCGAAYWVDGGQLVEERPAKWPVTKKPPETIWKAPGA